MARSGNRIGLMSAFTEMAAAGSDLHPDGIVGLLRDGNLSMAVRVDLATHL